METINQTEDLGTRKPNTIRELKGEIVHEQKIDDIKTFETELEDEITNASMFAKYEINSRFIQLMKDEPLIGTVTKVAGYRGVEELIVRTKILRWQKDIRPKTPDDREYIAFKGVNSKFSGTLGELIGNKSGKSYWGIRFDLGNGDSINYALTYGDIRILIDLKVFRLREGV